MLRNALRPTWFHLAVVTAAFLLLPIASVATVETPPPGCQQHEYVPTVYDFAPGPGSPQVIFGEPGMEGMVWAPDPGHEGPLLVGCETHVSTNRMMPLALLWYHGTANPPTFSSLGQDAREGYTATAYVQPTPALVVVPLAAYTLASLATAARPLYGDDWRRAARWLFGAKPGRVAFAFLGAVPFLAAALPQILHWSNDDALGWVNFALAPFWLLDMPAALAVFNWMQGSAVQWGMPGADFMPSRGHYDPYMYADSPKNIVGAMDAGELALAGAVAFLAWWLIYPFLRAAFHGLRNRLGGAPPATATRTQRWASLVALAIGILVVVVAAPPEFHPRDDVTISGMLFLVLWLLGVSTFLVVRWAGRAPWLAACLAAPVTLYLVGAANYGQGRYAPQAMLWLGLAALAVTAGAILGTRSRRRREARPPDAAPTTP
ncbi:MAG: hypothetical protein LC620_06100 [Halobacteriales archaeon]|nr:hypothetical protein [Halobacteriales archaeon]